MQRSVPHGDDTTHVFFGGLNAAGDGMGHGHAVIDREGTSCWPFLFYGIIRLCIYQMMNEEK